MAGGSKDLRYNVAVDASDASASLKKLSSDVKKTAKDIEGSFDDSASAGDKFKATVDELSSKLESEFKSAATAADKLGTALKDAGSKMDVGDAVADLTRMGFTFDEITADADKFANSLKQLDDVKIAGVKELDNVAPGLATKLDDVGKSADSSKSVLANMVGNSAQDLGAVAGFAGSAGVAIGQMGEYMADAMADGESFGSSLKNFAQVAGPIAALSLAVGAVSSVMGQQAKEAEESAKRTKEFGEAAAQAADDATAIADVLRKNEGQLTDFAASANDNLGGFGIAVDRLGEKIPLIGGLFERESVDVVNALKKAGLSVYEFSSAIEAGGKSTAEFDAALQAAKDTGAISGDEYRAIGEAVHELGKEYANSGKAASLYAVDQSEANAMLAELVTKENPLSKFGDTWATLMGDMADGSIDTTAAADAVNFLADSLGIAREEVISLAKTRLDDKFKEDKEAFDKAGDALKEWTDKAIGAAQAAAEFDNATSGADWGGAALDGAVTAMSAFSAAHFGLVDIAAASEEAFDKLSESVDKNGKTFDITTEKGRANQQALEDVAATLDTKLAAAYKDAGGDLDVFKGKASALAAETLTRLQKELGLSDKQTADLARSLGLLPEDIETRYELSGDEEAKLKIGLLSSAISALPLDVQAKVTQQIILGDYQGALATVQGYYNGNPADVKTEALPPTNLSTVGSVIGSYYNNNPVKIKADLVVGGKPYDQGGTVGPHGGVAGEVGPEFIATPDGRTFLVASPTPVAPGTKVTSRSRTRQILRGRAPTAHQGASSVRVDLESVAAVERRLAQLTRRRTARIDVAAVPSSVLVRVNGGG